MQKSNLVTQNKKLSKDSLADRNVTKSASATKDKELNKDSLAGRASENVRFAATKPPFIMLNTELDKCDSTQSRISEQGDSSNVTNAYKQAKKKLESTTKEVKTAVTQTFTALEELDNLLQANFDKKLHDYLTAFNISLTERLNEFIRVLIDDAYAITTPSEFNRFNDEVINTLERFSQIIIAELDVDDFLEGLPYNTKSSVKSIATGTANKAIAKLKRKAEELKTAAAQNLIAAEKLKRLIRTMFEKETNEADFNTTKEQLDTIMKEFNDFVNELANQKDKHAMRMMRELITTVIVNQHAINLIRLAYIGGLSTAPLI